MQSQNKFINTNNYIYESQINELKNELNEERNKNQILINENANLNEIIKGLNNENKNLNEMLNYESRESKNKIQTLEKNIRMLINKIKELKNQLKDSKSNNEKIAETQQSITENNLDNQNIITTIKPGEKILAVNFVSMGNNDIGHFNLVCKNIELFVRLEERLYENYPQYKDYETYFEVNGRRIKRFKTLDENNIKSNDIINIFTIEN